MPGDGVVRIGAEFDKTNVDAGLGSTEEMVKASMEAINASIVEAGAKSKAAWKSLSDEVKTGAESVSAEALKVAESSRAVAAAQTDVRRAITLTRDEAIPAAQSFAVLAAAQQKLAAEQAAAAAAQKEQAAAVATAAEEAALSSNALIAGFQRAGMAVRESLTSIQDKLVETAETGKLSAGGIAGAFEGLGSLLGAGIAVGFATHYVDQLAEMNVQLDHLATETGIDVTSLAGLQQIVREMGGEWEPIATGLTRMNKNLNDAVPPTKQLTEALGGIGLKFADLQALTPEEKLQKIAEAFAGTSNAANRTAAAYALFGRGGVALVPILAEQGAQLDANIKQTGALTGVTEQSAEAARRWTEDIARLSAQFRSVMIPVMEHAEDVVRGIIGVFDAGAATIVSAFELAATAIVSIYAPLYRLGVLAKDVFTGNWSAIRGDVESGVNAFADTWKAGFAEIKNNWAVVVHDFTYSTPLPKFQPGGFEASPESGSAPEKTGRAGAGGSAFGRDEEAYNELRIGHELSLDEEKQFWEQRLATARKGSEEYRQIISRLAEIAEKERRQPVSTPAGPPQTESLDLTISQADIDAEVKSNQDAAKQMVEADRAAAEEKMRIAAEDYRDVERNSEFEVQMGRMTAQQRIEILRQAAAQEQQLRSSEMRFVEMLDMDNTRRYEEDIKQQEQATREYTRNITQLNQQAALQVQNNWKRVWTTLNTDLTQVMNDWLRGTQNMTQAFAKMFDDILLSLADWAVKWLLKKAETWAQDEIQQALGLTAQKSAQASANLATVTADAAIAAAGALAYYSAINPVVAPAMAAAQYTMTMAYAPASVMDTGGILGSNRMAVNLSGADERVLSPTQTRTFDKVMNQSSTSNSSNVTHLNLTQNLNGYDRAGLKSALRSHADDILDIVRGGYRSGALSA